MSSACRLLGARPDVRDDGLLENVLLSCVTQPFDAVSLSVRGNCKRKNNCDYK
jgi:hypothetical protein